MQYLFYTLCSLHKFSLHKFVLDIRKLVFVIQISVLHSLKKGIKKV